MTCNLVRLSTNDSCFGVLGVLWVGGPGRFVCPVRSRQEGPDKVREIVSKLTLVEKTNGG